MVINGRIERQKEHEKRTKKAHPLATKLADEAYFKCHFHGFFYTHFNMKKEKTLTICRPEKKRSILDTTLERGRLGTKYTTYTIDVMVIFSSDIVDEICFTEVRNND